MRIPYTHCKQQCNQDKHYYNTTQRTWTTATGLPDPNPERDLYCVQLLLGWRPLLPCRPLARHDPLLYYYYCPLLPRKRIFQRSRISWSKSSHTNDSVCCCRCQGSFVFRVSQVQSNPTLRLFHTESHLAKTIYKYSDTNSSLRFRPTK